jgi:hypothetical protein
MFRHLRDRAEFFSGSANARIVKENHLMIRSRLLVTSGSQPSMLELKYPRKSSGIVRFAESA